MRSVDRGAAAGGPRAAVLLATRNGARFVREQLETILDQEGADVTVFVSDDDSSDDTLSVIESVRSSRGRVVVLPRVGRLGSAGANFFRLIREVEPDAFAYFCLADQDDIWMRDKVAWAIECMREAGASGYSGSVTAQWPDGMSRLVEKSGVRGRMDYMFEGPGPGCTFVMNGDLYRAVRRVIVEKRALLDRVHYHDWLIYAFSRWTGHRWFIDSVPKMVYRQHGGNDTGANAGAKALMFRAKKIWSGWARDQAYLIADVCGYGDLLRARFSYGIDNLLRLLGDLKEYRQSKLGRAGLFLAASLGKMRPPKKGAAG
jgi:rhamnosyltransferase